MYYKGVTNNKSHKFKLKGDNFMNLKISLALLPNVIFKKIGAIWDSMAQTTTTAIDFAHTNINPPPTMEQKWMYVLSKNVEHAFCLNSLLYMVVIASGFL